jgi:hypothetical protein
MNHDTLTQILNLARWAPSGDNTQPWRLEVVNETLIRVHGFDTRDHVLYDFDGHPSHMAHGALLETLRIAATGFGMAAHWTISSEGEHRNPVYDVTLQPDPNVVRDPLIECIETRTVQRRPMQTTPLTAAQRQALIESVGDSYSVQVFETFGERLKVAKLLWDSAKMRLTCQEAYPVHRDIIEWRARFSKDRIPELAVGVDPATARLMQWVMQSWGRVAFFNRYLLGTVAPRIQLDFLPAIYCAAHLLVKPRRSPTQLADWVELGMAVQRIWLTATQLGLHLQPEMTPVIFRWYARAGRRFSAQPELFQQAVNFAVDFERATDAKPAEDFGFFARVGTCQVPKSRSIRQELLDLMKV